MAGQDALSEWATCVSSTFPQLSKPQATVLAWWSYGIALTRSCGRGTVATFLALLLNQKVANIEQRLYDQGAKFRSADQTQFVWLRDLVGQVGRR